MPGAPSDDNRELSRLADPLPKIIVSDGLVVPADNPWDRVTTAVPRSAAAARVTAEKQRGTGDILHSTDPPTCTCSTSGTLRIDDILLRRAVHR